jgi:hypothetical protein
MATLVSDPYADDTLLDDEELVSLSPDPDEWSDDTAPPTDGPTAVEALVDPFASVASVKPVVFEAPVVDLDHCEIGGKQLHADVIDSVLDAEIERTIDGASTFTLTLADPDGTYRKSELIQRDVDCHIDGHDYRLANVVKQGTQLVLTFETLGIALLRQKKGYKRAWRRTHRGGKGLTRAEFVLSLVREVKHPKIPVTIPELHEVQPVGKFHRTPKRRDTNRDQGLSSDLRIKTAKINAKQIHNLTLALTEANRLKAQRKAILAMICAGIDESGWMDVMNGNQASVEQFKKTGQGRGSGYGGVLQGDVDAGTSNRHFRHYSPDDRTVAEAHYFLLGGEGYQGGGAIRLAKTQKTWTPGQIADRIEGSGAGGGFYQAHIKQAEAIRLSPIRGSRSSPTSG